MTDKDKLQKLFEAALKSNPEDFEVHPINKRVVPTSPAVCPTAAAAVEASKPEPVVCESTAKPAETSPDAPRALTKEESEELGKLLEEQVQRRRRKRRMEAMVTALFFLGSTGGGLAWFVSNPDRVEAFQSALREIRSVGDVKALVASYHESLKKISTRSGQIDQASMAMGINPADVKDEDMYMDAEMREMMGEEGGKTVGQRNKMLAEKFGDKASQNGVSTDIKTSVKDLAADESFKWEE
jgi:hypothetical protein